MFRRVLLLVIALAAVLMQAGLGEAVENVVHLAAHGHGAHGHAEEAQPADGNSHRDIEHGCVGHFHVCPCCSHLPAAYSRIELDILPANDFSESMRLAATTSGPEGIGTPIFRPPIGC